VKIPRIQTLSGPIGKVVSIKDALGLEGWQALESMVSRHSDVERLCGHIHRSMQWRFGNTMASTCPSSAHQVALDLPADGPDSFCDGAARLLTALVA
jgi:hypothetical protein